MGKPRVVLDTSAIISLGCTGKFQLVRDIFNLNSPMRVKEELVEISKTEDEIGKVAKDVLDEKFITFHSLPQNLQNIKGEIEVVNLAKELKAKSIVMDDLQYMKKLESSTKIPIWFSSYIIYTLCEKKVLTHKEGWLAIEDMKRKRDWKENLITEYAKLLFESGKKTDAP